MKKVGRRKRERERDKQRQASRKDDYAGDVVGIFHFPATFLPLHLTRESRGREGERGSEKGGQCLLAGTVGSIIILCRPSLFSLSLFLSPISWIQLEKRCMYLKCFSIDK